MLRTLRAKGRLCRARKTWEATVGQFGALVLAAIVAALVQVPFAADQIAQADPPPPPTELLQARTISSRTFDNHDGTYTTSLYPGPIHYRNAQGQWRPISSAVVPTTEPGYGLENEANRFRTLFKSTLANDYLALETAGGRFRVSLPNAAQVSAQAGPRKVTYPGVFPGVDLRYDLRPDGIKGTLLLQNGQAPTSYRFLLTPPANARIHAAQGSDGSWAFFMAPHARPVFVIDAPWATENEEPDSRRRNASLAVSRIGDVFALDLSVDPTWLRASGRQFPVRLDPTITIQPTIQDASFDFACPSCSGVASDRLSIGTGTQGLSSTTWRSALQFSLADIPPGATISDAKLKLFFDGTCVSTGAPTPCGGTSHQVDALRMTGSWAPNSKTSQLVFNSTPLASFTLPASAPAQWMHWNVTGTVQNWASGAQSNFGLLLKRATEPANASGPKPPSRNYAVEPTLGPTLQVTYNGDGGELLEPETVHSNGAELRWIPYGGPGAPPFSAYDVHRSANANFTPSLSTLLARITDVSQTSFRDTTARAGATFTYKVVVSGAETNARTVAMPADGQARKTLRPDSKAGVDTYITQRSDSLDCTNRGGNERLKVGTDAISIWRSLLRFNLVDMPATVAVTNATLSLWHPDTTSTALTVRAHRGTGDWQEGSGVAECSGDGATWYELTGGLRWVQDGGDYDPAVAASLAIPSGTAAGWSQWSLTSLVQQWITSNSANMGLLLKLNDETRVAGKSIDFHGSDFGVAPTLRPKLAITYSDGSHAVSPTVAVSKPTAGVQVSGAAVSLAAHASDDRRIENVEFFVDGNLVGTDASAPFSTNWNSTSVPNGPHNVTARATDDAGNQTTSAAVGLNVGNSATPTTSITSPTGGSVSGTVTVAANAADDVGVTKVEFYADGLLFATDTAAPYSAAWNTLDPALPAYDAAHSLTTKAYDAHQQVTTSSAITVTAANAAGTQYLADFSSPSLPAKVFYVSGQGTQPQYAVDVTVTNRSLVTWSATNIVLRYRWFRAGSTTAVFDSGNTSLGTAVLPGGQVTRQVLVSAPSLPTGLARASYTLRFDLYDQVSANWFAARGNKPLEQAIPAEQEPPPPELSEPEKLGIERMFQYDRTELGLGMENLVNVATGNSVVRWVPMQAPGRGLSSVVQLTYNSFEGRCNANFCPIGSGWSLSISNLTRFGKHVVKDANYLYITDADGTLHVFDRGDNGVWNPRAGTHWYVREDGQNPPGFIVTTPDRVTYTYDCGGNPTTARDKNGNQVTFILETPPNGCSSERVVDVKDAAQRAFHLEYYSGGPTNKRVKRISDHSGRSLQFCYDSGGDHANLIKIIDQPAGDPSTCSNVTVAARTVTFGYEGDSPQNNDQLQSVTDPRGRETHFWYIGNEDQANIDKLKERRDREGLTTDTRTSFSYALGSSSNQTTVLAPPSTAQRRAVYTDIHDSAHELGFVDSITRLKDPGPPEVTETTQIRWTNEAPPLQGEPRRHVWKVISPANRTTEFSYNSRGLLKDRYDPMLHHVHIDYLNVPSDGGLTSDPTQVIDANGNSWNFKYEGPLNNRNLSKIIDPNGSENSPFLEFTYYTGPPAFPGALQSVTDANKNPPTTFGGYDDNGFATLVTDGLGRLTKYAFDQDGLLRSVQDPRHPDPPPGEDERWYRTVFDYDGFHRRTGSSTPMLTGLHRVIYTSVMYDLNDNVTSSRQPSYTGLGEVTSVDYDSMDRSTLVTNPQNEKTAFAYDLAGRLTQVTRPKGLLNPPPPPPPLDATKDYSTEYKYDRLDRRVSRLDYDADGVSTRRTHFCYSLAGDLRWITAPRANLSEAPTSCENDTGAPSHTTRYAYDEAHRVTAVTELTPTQTRTRTFQYDDNGNVRHAFNENGTDTEFTYTARNEPEKQIETLIETVPVRKVTTFLAYDRAGNVIREVSPRAWDSGGGGDPGPDGAYVTDYRYNALNQLDRIALPDTAGGDPRAYIHRAYDENGDLELTTLPVENSQLGTLCATAPKQCTTLSRFDTGWIKTSDDHVNPPVNFDYRAEGWQESRAVCDADGTCKKTSTDYFSDGLPHHVRRSSDRIVGGNGKATYLYDENNNLKQADLTRSGDQPGSTMLGDYTGYDEPKVVSQQQQNEASPHYTDYTYDKNGNVATRIDNRTNTQSGRKHVFVYDQSDQLTLDDDWVNTTSGDVGDLQTFFDYEPTGWDLRKTVKRLDSAGNWQEKMVVERTYFANGKPKKLTNKTKRLGALTVVEDHTLAYLDSGVYVNGNRVSDQFVLDSPSGGCSGGCTTTWKYGPRDNVTEENNGSWGGPTTTWEYDTALNVKTETKAGVSRTFTYDGLRLRTEQSPAGDKRYLYDVEGNVDCIVAFNFGGTSCPAAPDVGGAPSASLIADYQWHFLGTLLSFRQFQEAGAGNRVTNSADALGRIVKETTTLGGVNRRTCFSHLGLSPSVSDERRVGLTDDCNAVPSVTKSYGFDADLERTTMKVVGGSDPGEYVYARNVHGDPSLLLRADGMQSGARMGSYGYTAYGGSIQALTREETQDTFPLNPYRFNDRRLEPASGSADMGRRYSSSTGAGRFLQPDSYEGAESDLGLSLNSLNMNRYGYAAGNPLSYAEIDGHAVAAVNDSAPAKQSRRTSTESRSWTAWKRNGSNDERDDEGGSDCGFLCKAEQVGGAILWDKDNPCSARNLPDLGDDWNCLKASGKAIKNDFHQTQEDIFSGDPERMLRGGSNLATMVSFWGAGGVIRGGVVATRASIKLGTQKGWRVGDSISAPTRAGNDPAWSTVRARYWKNAAATAVEGEYSGANLGRMRAGQPPLHDELGVAKELHHVTPMRQGGRNVEANLVEVWPWEHAAIDPYRFYGGPMP